MDSADTGVTNGLRINARAKAKMRARTSGFAVEVKEITDTIFRVVVKVAWITYAGKAVLQVFTSPFHIIKVR